MYSFARTKFVDENDLDAQSQHFFSEVEEFRQALLSGNLTEISKEGWDCNHSMETLQRIAEEQLGVPTLEKRAEVITGNFDRNYYRSRYDRQTPLPSTPPSRDYG